MYKNILIAVIIPLCVYGSNRDQIPEHLQDISVTISAEHSTGSGVLFSRKDKNGDTINFVWTAAHVIDGLRREQQIIAKDGSKRIIVQFKDARIVKQIYQDSRAVGRLEIDAEIIKYSDAKNGEDLALLRLRKKNFVDASTEFYLDEKVPSIGVELYHVGSLLGQMGTNSMTSGLISQDGRIIDKKEYTQTSCTAFPGSSGGGVFLRKDGRCIGLLVRGAGETFNLIVPIRRIKEFAKKTNIEWAINPTIELPSVEDISKISIEDVSELNLSTSQ